MRSPSLRVLLAEQQFSETGLTIRSVCAEAGWSLEMVFVDDRTNLAEALLAHCPDVAFLQLELLQPDAPALLGVLRRTCPSIPLILVADPADENCVSSCLSTGAQDFMLEGFMDEKTMARAIRLAVSDGADGVRQDGVRRRDALSGDVESQVGTSCEIAPQDGLVISVCIEEPEKLRSDRQGSSGGSALRDFECLLRAGVRSTDKMVRTSMGWNISLSGMNNQGCVHLIVQRIRQRLSAFCCSRFSGPLVYSITAEMDQATKRAQSNEVS